jgi:hypothetical protein
MKNLPEVHLLETYEKPQLEVIVFQLEDSIAASGESVVGLSCGEELF